MAGRKDATPEDLARLRTALENEIQRSALRAVAREVRMSATGLSNFLAGTKPYGGIPLRRASLRVSVVREWDRLWDRFSVKTRHCGAGNPVGPSGTSGNYKGFRHPRRFLL
jgi:hypothetical protein